jgi:FAD/FMN-containing dehydrogenase
VTPPWVAPHRDLFDPSEGRHRVTTRTEALSIPEIRAAVNGRVIAPDDPDYDGARTVVAGDIDRRPAVIVRVADVADVRYVVGLARDSGLELAVRSGGHSGAGHGVTEGGIVLDLRDMKRIEIDVEGRTAWAEAGLTAGEYTNATGAHGLATGFGDTGSVGLGGIALGGGVGYLARKHGLTIDSLLAADIVTADGELLRVDAEHHPDLFWAIRGGGGNFGVVTRFRFRLYPLESTVGGMLILPATPDTIAAFIAAAEAAPEELSTIANIMPCPPMPFVPEAHHGALVNMALMTYAGDAEGGERVLAPFRAIAEPIVDMLKVQPYADMYAPEDDSYRPTAVARTMFIDHVDRQVGETILEYLTASDASMRVAQLRVLGGAMARVPSDATAYAHRASRIMVNVAAFYDGPEDKPIREAWVAEFVAALHQGDSGAYVNFLVDEGETRVRAAYPGTTWDRLAKIKARYDPTNLFRLNQNIPPAAHA